MSYKNGLGLSRGEKHSRARTRERRPRSSISSPQEYSGLPGASIVRFGESEVKTHHGGQRHDAGDPHGNDCGAEGGVRYRNTNPYGLNQEDLFQAYEKAYDRGREDGEDDARDREEYEIRNSRKERDDMGDQ